MAQFTLPTGLNPVIEKKEEKGFTLPGSLQVDDKFEIKFDSTSSNPKEQKQEKGIFSKYIGTPITSAAFGVASGAERAVEGVVTLGTIMADAGLGTDLTAKVQKAFDESDILNYIEDKADDSWTGIVTNALVQFGVPGVAALKVANGLIKAKKAGTFASRRPNVTKALITGAAEMGAATDDMGTFGDLLGMGPTQVEDPTGETGRKEAFRRLRNKFRFGVEGALGFTFLDNVVFPIGKRVLKNTLPGLKSISKDMGLGTNKITYLKASDEAGRPMKVETSEVFDEGFQFNKNNILRWFDRNILAPLRPRGNLPKKVFEANRDKINKLRSVSERVRGETLALEKAVQQVVDPKGGGLVKILDKIGLRRREKLMEDIYDFLTQGKIKPKLDAKGNPLPITQDDLLSMKDLNIPNSLKDPIVSKTLMPHILKIRNSIDEMSGQLTQMPDIGFKKGNEFKDIVAANLGEYLTRSYKLHGTKAEKGQWLNFLKNSEKGQQIMQRARDYIKSQPEFKNATDDIVEAELEGILATTKEEQLGGAFVRVKQVDDAVEKTRQKIAPEIRELLGEIKDPVAQYYKAAAKINTYIEDKKFFDKIKEDGRNKYFFEENPNLKGQPGMGDNPMAKGQGGLEFGTQIKSDGPLNKFYTTDEIATALNKISDTQINADALSGIYQKLFLTPKALIQESKTTLSPVTHARNLLSALSFTGINGNFFRNPMAVVRDFNEARKIITAVSKSQLESQAGRALFKEDGKYQSFVDEYRRMQELGVVNTSARLGDLQKSMDEISAGLQNLNDEGRFYTILKGWGDKTGINKVRGIARLAYQTEDDIYKIQNFISEKNKLRQSLSKQIDPKVQQMATDDFGIGDLRIKQNLDEFIERKAADTVKNNIPNYDYVGSLGQTMRRLPVGNFISFPLEIMRTGINTLRQGIKEVQTPGMVGMGIQRLGGFFTFGLALGKGLEEGAQMVAGVSNESLNALKEYLPEWSKNSTLIPVKQNGQIYYVDFSHTNAYDVLTRPLNAAMNSFGKARENDESIMGSFEKASLDSMQEFLSPFVEESIITGIFADVFFRGGETRTGKRIWNPEDDFGTKAVNTAVHVLGVGSPGSLKQFERLYLSGFGELDQYNRGYKFLNEATGLIGFRIQDPFIEQGLNFKIADQKRAAVNSKKMFTSVAYSPTATADEIIAAYEKANEAKFRADQVLYKRVKAAQQLGMSYMKIDDILSERYSKKELNAIWENKFTPISMSDFVKEKISKNKQERGEADISDLIEFRIDAISNRLENNSLFDNPDSLFKESINIIEDRSPNITTPAFQINPTPPSSPPPLNLSQNLQSGFTLPTNLKPLSQSDVSQLAKSGDIDITEAIAARRT
tara:strand:- start:175 stop:4263 length:4089 start_codon:yes stop_codon:yes gene_type:complete